MLLAWRALPRLRVVVLALVWLLLLSWVALRPSEVALAPNLPHLVTASPSGFLPSNARFLPLNVLLQIGRLLEAGGAPLPTPNLVNLSLFHRHGLDRQPYAVLALAIQPLWFLLIYSCFIGWAAYLLRLRPYPGEPGAREGNIRTWLAVFWVGFLWLALAEALRVSGLFISLKLSRLNGIEPRHWPQLTFAWLLALLRVWAVLAMCVSVTQGGLFLGSARRLAVTLRARALPLVLTLLVGGFALRFFDWVVNATEVSSWPPSGPVAGLLGLVFIAARAILSVWVLASLLLLCAPPITEQAARAQDGPKKRPSARRRQEVGKP